ncbi:hypothetical protein BIV59_12830 [Bacillus sp. MUM 13]|nr:hypothetical protein BIV59_12830 [Bacillus sp. MUM 13]
MRKKGFKKPLSKSNKVYENSVLERPPFLPLRNFWVVFLFNSTLEEDFKRGEEIMSNHTTDEILSRQIPIVRDFLIHYTTYKKLIRNKQHLPKSPIFGNILLMHIF